MVGEGDERKSVVGSGVFGRMSAGSEGVCVCPRLGSESGGVELGVIDGAVGTGVEIGEALVTVGFRVLID